VGAVRGLAANQSPGWDVGPDGKTIVYGGGFDRTLRFWDPIADKEVRRLENFVQFPTALGYSADGKRVAVVVNGRSLQVLSTESGEGVRNWDSEMNQWIGHMLALGSDGRRVAAGGNGSIRLWDAESGAEIWKRDPNGGQYATLPVFAPDGRTLAFFTGQQVRVVEVISRQPRLLIERPPNNGRGMVVQSLALSPDGRMLAIGTSQGEVELHDVATGKEIGKLNGHRGNVTALAFSPDGRLLASGAADATVLLWDAASLVKKLPLIPALKEAEIATLWKDLGAEGAKAHGLIWAMTSDPKKAVDVIKDKLRATPPADPKRIAKLIADLDSDDFETRKKASQALEGIPQAVPELKKALTNNPSPEQKRRIDALLAAYTGETVNVDELRESRALEALELMATPEAKALLETLAKGPADAPLTRECKAALERLARKTPE
jgi:WD40 repeat protein